jgi:hypothetical protein
VSTGAVEAGTGDEEGVALDVCREGPGETLAGVQAASTSSRREMTGSPRRLAIFTVLA